MIFSLLLAMAAVLSNQDPKPDQAAIMPVKIQFVGREHLAEKVLLQAAALELDAFRQGPQRRSRLDDAAFLMAEAYRQEGFPDAQVRWSLAVQRGISVAQFKIEEGRSLLLGTLQFHGALAISGESLAGLLGVSPNGKSKHAFRRSELESLAASIRQAYWQLGYLETSVVGPEFHEEEGGTRRGASYQIEEGTCFMLRGIVFAEPGPLGTEALATVVEDLVDQPYFPRRQVELAHRLRLRYAQAAYPEIKVEVVETRDSNTGVVTLAVSLKAGMAATISAIEVEGNIRTNADFIRQRMGIQIGEPYNRDALDDAFLGLFRTGLFRAIKIELGAATEISTDRPLIAVVEEAPGKELSFRSGYGSYEGLRFGTSFVERNLFGSGRRFRTNLDASQVGWSAELGWTDPWLLNSEIALDVPLYIRRRKEPSFTREELGFGWNLHREFSHTMGLGGGWSLKRSRISAVTVSTGPEVIAEDVDIATYFLQPEYDSRNDFFNPTSGSLARFRVESAGYDPFRGDISFLRTRLDLSHLRTLTDDDSLVLAFAWRAGLAWPLGSTERLPLQERFFNGGEDSVRSFREGELGPSDSNRQPQGGESYHTANIELRQQVQSNLWASIFIDAGNVGLRADDLIADLRYGIGAGLRYLLPVGALRLDYAWNPDRREGDSSYQIFLTVGMAF